MSVAGNLRKLMAFFHRDFAMAVRFAIILLVFPLPYYISHPETYYFRPVDPLIVILAAIAVASRASPHKAPA